MKTEIKDAVDAVLAIEGDENNPRTILKAWAYLIKTGAVWKLQGFYGRTATHLIKEKVISGDGVINWELTGLKEEAEDEN